MELIHPYESAFSVAADNQLIPTEISQQITCCWFRRVIDLLVLQ